MESDTFYGDFMAKLVQRLSGVFIEKTWIIRLPDNFHINFTINLHKKYHSPYSPYYLHNFYIL